MTPIFKEIWDLENEMGNEIDWDDWDINDILHDGHLAMAHSIKAVLRE